MDSVKGARSRRPRPTWNARRAPPGVLKLVLRSLCPADARTIHRHSGQRVMAEGNSVSCPDCDSAIDASQWHGEPFRCSECSSNIPNEAAVMALAVDRDMYRNWCRTGRMWMGDEAFAYLQSIVHYQQLQNMSLPMRLWVVGGGALGASFIESGVPWYVLAGLFYWLGYTETPQNLFGIGSAIGLLQFILRLQQAGRTGSIGHITVMDRIRAFMIVFVGPIMFIVIIASWALGALP